MSFTKSQKCALRSRDGSVAVSTSLQKEKSYHFWLRARELVEFHTKTRGIYLLVQWNSNVLSQGPEVLTRLREVYRKFPQYSFGMIYQCQLWILWCRCGRGSVLLQIQKSLLHIYRYDLMFLSLLLWFDSAYCWLQYQVLDLIAFESPIGHLPRPIA